MFMLFSCGPSRALDPPFPPRRVQAHHYPALAIRELDRIRDRFISSFPACFDFIIYSPRYMMFILCHRPTVSRTTSLAAEWKPADGDWKEKDYEKELAKLEKEAEERLDAKIAEMMAKIETTGAN